MEPGGQQKLPKSDHPKGFARAMLLEDDEIDQMLIERMLVSGGVTQEVTSFRLARHGLEYLKQKNRTKFDLIVVDLGLPLMGGLEFLLAASADHPTEFENAVVVVVTSSQDEDDYTFASSMGVVELYLAKPFTPDHAFELLSFDRDLASTTVSIASN